jgi:rhodanese-related sulfurtransferase/DNA-binding transcriptional ArsR family regulator
MRAAKRHFKDSAYEQLARVGEAISSPKRLELLDLLCQSERSVEDLAGETGMSLANTSQHLKVLRAGRLVEARKVGRSVLCRLADQSVGDFFIRLLALAEGRLAEIEQIKRRYLEASPEMEPVDGKTLLGRARRGEVLVIDVRPASEYHAAHLPHAISVPLDELERRLSELPRDREIIAYCRGPFCLFAPEAVRQLRDHGFHAFRMETSIYDWRAQGLPVVSREEHIASEADLA